MDEDRSPTHDPAARLGRASEVPDGIERLAGPPASPDRPAPPASPDRTAPPAFSAGSGNRGGGNGAAAATEVAEPEAGPTPTAAATNDADTTDAGVDVGDEHDSDDPPPRWAGGREPGSTPPPGPAEPADAGPPARRSSGRSAYWAAAVLVIFGAIAAIGLVKSGGDDPEPSASQGRETTATTAADDEGGEGEAAPAGDKPSTSVEDQTTTTTAGARGPAVGECAVLDVAPEPDEYVQVPCDAPTAAVQLSQVVPSPAPAGAHCPQGTDTVAQVTADASVGRAAPELWCLRNVAPPHPGDPGGGGGELVVGDCLGAAPSGQSIEVPCDGTGLPPEYVVGWLPDATGVCPPESVATVNLATPFPGAYCLRYKP